MNSYDLAKLFHETYERRAPEFGYETRKETAKPWDELTGPNKRLMIAVANEVLRVLEDPDMSRRRFSRSEIRELRNTALNGLISCVVVGSIAAVIAVIF